MTNVFDLIPDVISPEEINPLGVWGNDNDWDDDES